MKKLFVVLLALCLVVGLAPVNAQAEEQRAAILLVNNANKTGGINGWDSANGYDYVYYGNWANKGANETSPLKWRVLDTKTNMVNAQEGDGLFLLSEELLGDNSAYDGVYFNQNTYSQAWQGSDAQKWCKDFAGEEGTSVADAFSDVERAAIQETAKSDVLFSAGDHVWQKFLASENILNEDKVFFLSAEEVMNANYGFTNDAARQATGAGYGVWWLRSPSDLDDCYSGGVAYDGEVLSALVYYTCDARPAFNLDLSKVLFTSAAKDGKPKGFTAISDYTGNEWKLTLLDSTRNFDVYQTAVTAKAGSTITLSYNGATFGTNEYISVIIADDNDALYYGRIAQPADNGGEADITIPSDLPAGSYTLKVFNEQYNGDYQTDYASAFCNVTLTIDNQAPSIGNETAVRTGAATATVTFTSSEAGTYWYAVAEPDADAPTIDRTGSGYPCVAGTNTISLTNLSTPDAKALYYIVSDHAGNLSGPFLCDINSYTPAVTVTTDGNGTADAYLQDNGYACVVVQAGIGYELDNVTVKDANGYYHEYEFRLGGGQIVFQMPDCDVTVHLTFKPCTVVYFDSDSSNWEYVWARVYDERGNNIALDTSRKDHRGYSVLNVPDGYTKIFFQNVAFGAPYEAQMTAKMEIVPNRVYAYLIQSPTEDETITVYEGDMATMAIETKDGLTYQWQINYNDGTGWHNCGENSPVYTSSPTKLSNSGYRYRCQVTSTTGAICTSHIFTLEVLEKIELPETGDSSNPLLWLTMSLLSLLGIVLMRKKCEQ